jgi:lysophospholipase L1-like esterase
VLATALVGVAAELGARRWIRRRTGYYVWPPGMRLELRSADDGSAHRAPRVRFDVNADGERGRDVRPEEPGLFRVLAAGGSSVECLALTEEVSWPGALERILNAPENLRTLGAQRVHVGNIGRSGVSSRHLDLILERVLPRYPRLSAIVILVGASDVLRWLEEGATAAPSALPPIGEIFRCHPEGPFGWTPRTLAATELARRAHRRLRRPERVHEQAGRWLRKARAMRAQAKIVRASMPDPVPMLVHFETHLRRAILRAQAHADRVVIVRQSWFAKETLTPEEMAHMWHGGAGQAWRDAVTTYYSIDVTARLMELLDASAVSVADALGVEAVDLSSVLEPNLTTYYDYFHLTPYGAQRVAAAVAQTLARGRGVAAGEVPPCADLRAS